MAETMTAKAKRGAKFLDEEIPGWAKRIDLDKLDLQCCGLCPLGQLFGGFWYGILEAGN